MKYVGSCSVKSPRLHPDAIATNIWAQEWGKWLTTASGLHSPIGPLAKALRSTLIGPAWVTCLWLNQSVWWRTSSDQSLDGGGCHEQEEKGGHKGNKCPLHVLCFYKHRRKWGGRCPPKLWQGFLQVIGLGQNQIPVFIKSVLSIPTRVRITTGVSSWLMIPKTSWRSSSRITGETEPPKAHLNSSFSTPAGPELGAQLELQAPGPPAEADGRTGTHTPDHKEGLPP